MKWRVGAGVLVGLLVLLTLVMARREAPREAEVKSSAKAVATVDLRPETPPEVEAKAAKGAVQPQTFTAAEKAARVEKIRADYDAIRKGVADELAAVSAAGPGPFGETRVFLRRLVLLQREERADLAQVLDARELEDYELRESPAGQLVATRLGATAAPEEQRRAVFRIEREFDDRFGFVFDVEKEALAERREVRKETDARIRAVLGEELFRVWMEAAMR